MLLAYKMPSKKSDQGGFFIKNNKWACSFIRELRVCVEKKKYVPSTTRFGIRILYEFFKITDMNSNSADMNLLKIILTQIFQLAPYGAEVVV